MKKGGFASMTTHKRVCNESGDDKSEDDIADVYLEQKEADEDVEL